MTSFEIRGSFIELYKLLKAAGIAENGAEAKHWISDGRVRVNGQVETRKACKLVDGDRVEYGDTVLVVKAG